MIHQTQPLRKTRILLFTTNLMHEYDVHRISQKLDRLNYIFKWTVDLFDWERVLRVETNDRTMKVKIKSVLKKAGYYCNDLNH